MELSPTMKRAVEYMRSNGNEMHRFPGGFWHKKGGSYYQEHFGTTTMNAMEQRCVIKYTEWRDNKTGRFPIKAKLTDTYRK